MEIGGDLLKSPQELTPEIQNRAYHVVVLNLESFKDQTEGEHWLAHFHRANPRCRKILVNSSSSEALSIFCEKFSIYQIFSSFDDPNFKPGVEKALELSLLDSQKQEMAKLIQEQNDKLQSLYLELEKRVERRQLFLMESEQKVLKTNSKLETLREALNSILEADNTQVLETRLNSALNKELGLSWTRIFYRPQDHDFLEQSSLQMTFSLVRCPLFQNSEDIGSIFYLRPKNKPFHKEEVDLLNKVSEGASLAVGRILKRNQSETLRMQWEATFNALSDPVCIVDKNYSLQQANESFLRSSPLTPGKKCFEVLFERDTPCESCHLGQSFRQESPKDHRTVFDVSSHSVKFADEHFFVNVYRNNTEQLDLENKIIESAKLAELGTIGSSIAHELNNPLGGILAYVQLLKMESSPESPHYADFTELEKGTIRCRDIIQNLLTFSRKTDYTSIEKLELNEILTKAISLFDVQTRSLGTEVHFDKSPLPLYNENNRNLFLQLITQVLTLFQSELKWDKQFKVNHKSKIQIETQNHESFLKIAFIDMSLGPQNRSDKRTKSPSSFEHILKQLGVDMDIFHLNDSIHVVELKMRTSLETRF